jgi:hypothetical protein
MMMNSVLMVQRRIEWFDYRAHRKMLMHIDLMVFIDLHHHVRVNVLLKTKIQILGYNSMQDNISAALEVVSLIYSSSYPSNKYNL